MVYVAAHRELGSLNPDEIFIVSRSTFQSDPWVSLVTLILVTLDKVPSEYKVLRDVINTGAYYAHCHVVPRHASVFYFAQLVGLPVLDILKVQDAVVVEVLAREDFVLDT
jgi:hypothetical protein